MANAFTGGSSGAAWDLLVEAAYDRSVEYFLRDIPQWRQVIDKRPVAQAMPGDTVTLSLHNAIGLATTPLTETVDPDSVAAPAPTRVTITLNEYGNATLATLKLKTLGFTRPDQELVELVGRNMYDSVDALVQAVADGSTNIITTNSAVLATSGGTDVLTTTTDIYGRKQAVTAISLLRRNKVMPRVGSQYAVIIHPDVAYDLQAENSASAWLAPHTYGTDTSNVYSGVIGDFMGGKFIETTRCKVDATAGAGSKPVYSTYHLGAQAIAEASAIDPHTVVGPQVDKLKRFFPLGWYGVLGWSIYRPQAIWKTRTSSTIAGL